MLIDRLRRHINAVADILSELDIRATEGNDDTDLDRIFGGRGGNTETPKTRRESHLRKILQSWLDLFRSRRGTRDPSIEQN